MEPSAGAATAIQAIVRVAAQNLARQAFAEYMRRRPAGGPLQQAELDDMIREVDVDHARQVREYETVRDGVIRKLQESRHALRQIWMDPATTRRMERQLEEQTVFAQELCRMEIQNADTLRNSIIDAIRDTFARHIAGNPPPALPHVRIGLMNPETGQTFIFGHEEDEVRTAPLPPITMKRVSAKPDPCPICMEGFVADEQLPLIPCLHEFHTECWKGYMQSKCHNQDILCPICKTRVYDE